MSRIFITTLAVTLATCIGVTARSQSSQTGGAPGAQAPGAAANAAGQTRGGVGTTPPVVSEANPVGGQNPALGVNAAGQARGGFGNRTGFVGFNGISRTPFFTDPGVQQQLGLSADELALLNEAYADNWTRYNQGVLGIGNNVPAQRRLMELQRLEAQFNEGFGQTVNSTFTNPELMQRFNQLNWQFQNFGAFNDPIVREQLSLTPQQQRQIRRLSNQWQRDMRRLRRAGDDVDPQLADQQFNQMQALYQEQLNQVLSAQQQQTWNGLIGERHSFPRTSFVPPDEDLREEFSQRRIIPHDGIDNGTAQDQNIRRNVTPHNRASGTGQQNQGARRNVTPHGGTQSAQGQGGSTVR